MSNTDKIQVTIEDWEVVNYFGCERLAGKCFGHPKFPQGHDIFTSQIVKMDVEAGWVETMNTVYKLGKKAQVAEG